MKRWFLPLALLAGSTSAAAPVPPDIQTLFGASGWSQVTPTFKTDGTANTPIDPAITPMPVGLGMTNIPIPSNTNRIVTNGPYSGTTSPFCGIPGYGGGCGAEAKFRTQADFSHMLPDDPIRNYGQPGASHLHCFFGGGSTNAFSTYKSLRQHSLDSFASGTDANGTGYWYPCPLVQNPYSNGKNYAIRADFITIYYAGTPADMQTAPYIPIGLRYVFGFDMDSSAPGFSGTGAQYSWLKAILDAANTTSGHIRYSLAGPNGVMSDQGGWICGSSSTIQGMPNRSTVQRWQNEDDEFDAAVTHAREEGFHYLAEQARISAHTAEDAAKGRLAFDADRWYLGKLSNAFSDNKAAEARAHPRPVRRG
jgi:hypothetical protein